MPVSEREDTMSTPKTRASGPRTYYGVTISPSFGGGWSYQRSGESVAGYWNHTEWVASIAAAKRHIEAAMKSGGYAAFQGALVQKAIFG